MSKLRTPVMIRSSSQMAPVVTKDVGEPAPSLKGCVLMGGRKFVSLSAVGIPVGSKGLNPWLCGFVTGSLTLLVGSIQLRDMVSFQVGNPHHVCPAPGEAMLSPDSRGAWLLLFKFASVFGWTEGSRL